jgi:hypothetical protein
MWDVMQLVLAIASIGWPGLNLLNCFWTLVMPAFMKI